MTLYTRRYLMYIVVYNPVSLVQCYYRSGKLNYIYLYNGNYTILYVNVIPQIVSVLLQKENTANVTLSSEYYKNFV